MRTKIVAATAVGVLGVGLLGVPAFAAGTDTTAGPAAAVASGVSRISEALKGLVTDGTLTQAQADKVASTLSEAMPDRGGRGGHGHGPGRPGLRGGQHLDAAALALGLTADELRTELQAGKSLATVAQDKGVTLDSLVAALVEDEKKELADAVASGRLTQAQADERAGRVDERVRTMVERVPGQHPERGKGPGDTSDGSTSDGAASSPAS